MRDPRDILARAPINGTAASVLSKGVEYTPDVDLQNDSELPIPMRPFSSLGNTNSENLTGREFGRLTVLGLSTVNGSWVCRCSCGIYTRRKRKAILNPQNHGDRCQACRHLESLKRSEIWRRTGKNVRSQV